MRIRAPPLLLLQARGPYPAPNDGHGNYATVPGITEKSSVDTR